MTMILRGHYTGLREETIEEISLQVFSENRQ